MHSQYNATRPGGISAPNRERLVALHRKLAVPFTVPEAARVLNLDTEKSRKFLAYLASRGWLSRIRRGLYITVPLEAGAPSDWREDPWVVAFRTFEPFYIGGWSATEHWGLTDQVFRDVVVITSRKVRNRRPNIQGTAFRVKVVPVDQLFGTETVWRNRSPVKVSDPSRTVADVLDDPSLGGGIRQVAEVVAAYFSGPLRNGRLLLDYIERLNNRTIYKRLGYLIEASGIKAPELVQVCLERRSSGFSYLDPTIAHRGHVLRRWNLRINAHIAALEEER